jgi:hypothetical protein
MSAASFDLSQLPGGFDTTTMQSFPAASRLTALGQSPGAPFPIGIGAGGGVGEFSHDSLATYTSAYSHGAARASLFGDELQDTDLEAASALNILSNSPALKRKTTRGEDDGGDDNNDGNLHMSGGSREDNRRGTSRGTKPKSLFDVVVGKQRSPKK